MHHPCTNAANAIPLKLLTLILTIIIIHFVLHGIAYAGDNIELSGDILQYVIPMTAGGMALYKVDTEGVGQFSKSFLSTLATTYALKYTIDERRPSGGPHSFPSGHTAASFSGASFIQKRYGWEYGIPAYIAASFVGWSRIESSCHYTEDVLAGAAIGTIFTYIFTDAYETDIVVTPLVGEKIFGVQLSLNF